MWDKWVAEKQYFNKFRIVGKGIEVLNIKEKFDCKDKIIIDDWSILKLAFYGEVFDIKKSSSNPSKIEKKNENIIKENIENALMLQLFKTEGYEVNDFMKLSLNFQNETMYYYNTIEKKLKSYEISTQGFKLEQTYGSIATGIVKYEEDNITYTASFSFNKNASDSAISDFEANLIKGTAESFCSEYLSKVVDLCDELTLNNNKFINFTKKLKDNKDFIENCYKLIEQIENSKKDDSNTL